MGLFVQGGHKKDLFCKKCNKFTNHISITYAEADDLGYFDSKSKLAALVMDNSPYMFLLGTPYMCTGCRTLRHDGSLLGLTHR